MKIDQSQKVPSKGRDSKNIAETLGTVGCRTQKSPKITDPSTKQRNQIDQRSCRLWTTSEEAKAGTVPHVPTHVARVVLARNNVVASGTCACGFWPLDFFGKLIGGR